MNLEEMKKLYESGDYVCYHRYNESKKWDKFPIPPRFNEREQNYKLIHKKHKAIAEAVIANPSVKVEQKTNPHQGWIEDNNFFNNYQDWHAYQLAKPTIQQSGIDSLDDLPILGEDEGEKYCRMFDEMSPLEKETISISSDDGTVYEFIKPEFECELLNVVDNYCIGYYIETYKAIIGEHKIPTFWNLKDGNCYKGGGISNSKFSLTPLKRQWYENKSNFPCLMLKGTLGSIKTSPTRDDYLKELGNGYRLATKEEVQSLYYEGKGLL